MRPLLSLLFCYVDPDGLKVAPSVVPLLVPTHNTHTHTHTHTHTRARTHTHTCAHTRTHTYTHTNAHTQTHIRTKHMQTEVRTRAYTHTHHAKQQNKNERMRTRLSTHGLYEQCSGYNFAFFFSSPTPPRPPNPHPTSAPILCDMFLPSQPQVPIRCSYAYAALGSHHYAVGLLVVPHVTLYVDHVHAAGRDLHRGVFS